MRDSRILGFLLFILISVAVMGSDFDLSKIKIRYSVGSPESEQVFTKLDNNFCITKGNRIFVSDMREAKVVQFDPNGKLVGIVGKGGSGPGEYRMPFTVISNDKQILVSDMMRRRVLIYAMDGEIKGNIDGHMVERFVDIDAEGNFYAITMGAGGRSLLRFSSDGSKSESIMELGEKRGRADFMAAPTFTLTAFENGYVFVPGEDFHFLLYNTKGEAVDRVSQEFERVAYVEEDHPKGGFVSFGGSGGNVAKKNEKKFETDIQRIAPCPGGFWVSTAFKNDKGDRLVYTYDMKGVQTGKLLIPDKIGMPYRVTADTLWTMRYVKTHGIIVLVRSDI